MESTQLFPSLLLFFCYTVYVFFQHILDAVYKDQTFHLDEQL